MEFIPGMQSWFNTKKANKVIHRVNQLKKKKDIIPIQAEKAYDKILSWTPIHDKKLSENQEWRENSQFGKEHL